jgi:hypothetical protein
MSARDGILFDDNVNMGLIKGIGDGVKFRAKVKARLIHPNGKEELFEFKNTLTELGEALIADALSDRSITLNSHMAIGNATGSKTSASTTLQSELARVALDSTTQGTGGNDNDVTWIATFPAGTGTGSLVEAGLFNDVTAGTMFSFTDFGVITKGAADILIFSWTLTCGAS